MKLVMTLLVKNEEDIIKDNIEYHLDQGVDFIIAMDNASTDGTTDILKFYWKKNKLHYIFQEENTHDQGRWVTQMARTACCVYGADWVINNDADEFWWPLKEQNLKSLFSSLSSEVNIVEARRKNFVALEDYNKKESFYGQMIYKETTSLNSAGRPLPPKRAHRALKDIIVGNGNHKVDGFKKPETVKDFIEIFHFPLRNKAQFTNKIKNGAAALERNSNIGKHVGSTWRKLYKQLLEQGDLEDFFSDTIYDEKKLEQALLDNQLVIDQRLNAFMQGIHENH